ncbi:unnamed protein product [Ascophyllum nodosum]
MRSTPYREAVGALMWAATMTRPDVAYAAHQLGRFNDNPRPAHWRAANRALQYLWRAKDYVALAEVVNELRFLRQVEGFLTPPIDENIVIREYKEKTLEMATNRFSSWRRRYVHVKYHIVRDAIESGIIRTH